MAERDFSQMVCISVYIFAMGYAYFQIRKEGLVWSKAPWKELSYIELALKAKSLYRHNIVLINWVLIIVFSMFMDIALLQQFALQQVVDKPFFFFIGAPGYVITSIVIWKMFDNKTSQYKALIKRQSTVIQELYNNQLEGETE